MCFPYIHNIPPQSKKNDDTETFLPFGAGIIFL